MPFHIAYSGPAPVSTYFRTQSAREPTFGRQAKNVETRVAALEAQSPSNSHTTLLADSQSLMASSSSSTLVDVDMHQSDTLPSASSQATSRHYTSAFRGRSMHGLRIDLPDGYSGIVLQTPDDTTVNGRAPASRAAEEARPKSRAKAKPTVRTTRRAKRAEEDVEDAVEDPLGAAQLLWEGSTRVLRPAAQFASFVLWHPDIPVDEGRDEYIRSLTEWTKLAAEIHRVEDC
ncbi:hypothetical protein BN946_scf184805.g51 [Trametes cinnabarina]|uniref:Uncharacterized protein n=1 Tax=Pycnoporus cinnabarinus TaxID=5643 RepID=A0A060S380_PYCCI|nr:hypothetical protein BN946_scf184805.g51 [Trametes cinnabarina]